MGGLSPGGVQRGRPRLRPPPRSSPGIAEAPITSMLRRLCQKE